MLPGVKNKRYTCLMKAPRNGQRIMIAQAHVQDCRGDCVLFDQTQRLGRRHCRAHDLRAGVSKDGLQLYRDENFVLDDENTMLVQFHAAAPSMAV